MSSATLHDIAEAASASIASVSKVLRGRSGVGAKKRDAILEAAASLNYRSRPRKRKASQNPLRAAHLFAPEYILAHNHFYDAVMEGMSEAALGAGLSLQVHCIPEGLDISAYLQDTLPTALDEGLLLMGMDTPAILDVPGVLDRPVVLINGVDHHMRVSSVSPDYLLGAYLATRALLDLGHQKIAHITNAHRFSLRLRQMGFREALEVSGLPFVPEHHLLDLQNKHLQSSVAFSAMRDFLSQGELPYTALFCVSDLVALGVIQALQASGYRVPEDVSVIGFDDLLIGKLATPSLSSVHIDRADLGRSAIGTLLEQCQPPFRIVRVNTAVSLMVRDSIAAPSETSQAKTPKKEINENKRK